MRLTPLVPMISAALLVAANAAHAAHAQNASSFTIVHRTGEAIVAVYAGPSTDDHWGDNILAERIRSDMTMEVTLQTGRFGCMFDLKYDFADGDTFEEYKVNVCNIRGEQYVLE